MSRSKIVPVLLCLVLSGGVSAQEHMSVYQMVRAGIAASENGQCAQGLELLGYAAERRKFADLPRVMQDSAIEHLLHCSDMEYDWSYGLPHLVRWIESRGESAFLLTRLLVAGVEQEDGDILYDALVRLVRISPESVNDIWSGGISQGLDILQRDADPETVFRYLALLNSVGYQPYDTIRPQDYLKVEYARALAGRDELTAARAIIRSITNPTILLEVRIDKRFDAVRADGSIEDALDLSAAAERLIEATLAAVKEYPTTLEAYLLHQRALMGAWRFDEALSFVNPVIEEINDGNATETYWDYNYEANWVMNNYAVLLKHLGRFIESDEAFEKSSTLREQDGVNVSQSINYARELLGRGEYEKALELVSAVTAVDASTYGMMWARSTEVCAMVKMDEERDYTAAISYLIFNASSNIEAMVKAYLCIGDQDRAAELVIKSLKDPIERIGVLLLFQNLRQDDELDKARKNGLINELDNHFRALAEREDVAREIDAVGRIEEVWLHTSVW